MELLFDMKTISFYRIIDLHALLVQWQNFREMGLTVAFETLKERAYFPTFEYEVSHGGSFRKMFVFPVDPHGDLSFHVSSEQIELIGCRALPSSGTC